MFRFLIFVATMAKGKPRHAARHFLETTTSNENYLGSLMADAASESTILVRNPEMGSHFSLDVIGYSQKKCALFVIVYEPAFDRIDKKSHWCFKCGGAHVCWEGPLMTKSRLVCRR